jgi:hypothetical protein
MAGRSVALAIAAVVGILAALIAGAIAADVDWPRLKPGLWQFTRTMEGAGQPTTIERRICTDPVDEWKKMHASSKQSGCSVTTKKVSANQYVTTALCDIPDVGKGSSRSTATIESDSRYEVTVENEGVAARTGTREHLVATRVGDCPR